MLSAVGLTASSLPLLQVTASGIISLEFRVPRAHQVPQGLSSPSQERLLIIPSWQAKW